MESEAKLNAVINVVGSALTLAGLLPDNSTYHDFLNYVRRGLQLAVNTRANRTAMGPLWQLDRKQRFRQFIDLRSGFVDEIRASEPQKVEGPAMVMYVVMNGRREELEWKQLHPGESYEGKCIVWDQGTYD